MQAALVVSSYFSDRTLLDVSLKDEVFIVLNKSQLNIVEIRIIIITAAKTNMILTINEEHFSASLLTWQVFSTRKSGCYNIHSKLTSFDKNVD